MASARYGYMTASPSDRPLKRPHSELLAPAYSTAGTPRSKPPPVAKPNGASIARFETTLVKDEHASDLTDNAIFKSAPIHDRKSTFVGYYSLTLAPLDLQSHPSIESADHKMLAYRISSSAPLSTSSSHPKNKKVKVSNAQSSLPWSRGINGSGGTGAVGMLQTGQDDDGENYGGKKVMGVMMQERVEGSLVVARWYGGVMLGPIRFAHIEDAARGAVRAWRESKDVGLRLATGMAGDEGQEASEVDGGSGETAEEEAARLREELPARDDSITSLRKLLKTKKALLAQLEGGEGDASQESPAKKIQYVSMPLERLRLLDKARDNTVAFLLKQIDGVEEKITSWTTLDELQDDEPDDAATKEVKATPVGTKGRGA